VVCNFDIKPFAGGKGETRDCVVFDASSIVTFETRHIN
jgi:hypothetical protein